jgi:predicted enzyme related to lactoylglutathione lyase
MTVRLQNVSIDSLDPSRLASFWAEVLGWRVTSDDGEEVVLEPPAGSRDEGVVPDLVFIVAPDGHAVKNRVHVDLRPDDQLAEVQRLVAMGATHVDIGQPSDCTWVVLADLEGNEFCVLRAFTEEEMASLA